MMTTEILGYLAVGLVLIVFGLLTWKKQTTRFIHSYHYKNVKEEAIPDYTKWMGIGQIIVGAGFCLAALFRLMKKTTVSWAVLIAGLVIGLVFILKALAINREA